jgi:hypothetical protein
MRGGQAVQVSEEDRKAALAAVSASDRPKGMTKRQWKDLKKSQYNVDNYGLTQEERSALAAEGWSVTDLDELSNEGFSVRDCQLLAASGYAPDDIWFAITSPEFKWTSDSLMAFVRRGGEVEDIPEDEEEDLDDIPVADRRYM